MTTPSTTVANDAPLSAQRQDERALLDPSARKVLRAAKVAAFNGGMISCTMVFQGLNARYYHLRVARIREYLNGTPPWILDLQRSTVIE